MTDTATQPAPIERAREREIAEKAWRDGFQCARDCVSDDAAFCLTDDVEQDAWLDSDTRRSLPDED